MSEAYRPEHELERLYKAIQGIATPQALGNFLAGILTPVELRDLGLRWALLERLLDGQPQRAIAKDLGISLCKITRGARVLKQPDSPVGAVLREQMTFRERWYPVDSDSSIEGEEK
jgi:TrpR family trp operon transcriptional repressor